MPGGRPRKPHRLRALEGGRGKSRPLTPDLPAPSDPLAAPAGLSKAERAAWRVHVEWIRKLTLESCVDAGQVEALVRMYCRARKADAVIARRGPTMVTIANGTTRRPEVSISIECWKFYQQLANQFGLSPTARAKLTPTGKAPEGAGDVPAELRDASRG